MFRRRHSLEPLEYRRKAVAVDVKLDDDDEAWSSTKRIEVYVVNWVWGCAYYRVSVPGIGIGYRTCIFDPIESMNLSRGSILASVLLPFTNPDTWS